jgi:RNA polymerase sigma-70 factor, ECF subfamily
MITPTKNKAAELNRLFESTDFQGKFTTYLINKGADPKSTKRLLNETYIRAKKGIHSFKGLSRLETWVYRIGTNYLLADFRKKQTKGYIRNWKTNRVENDSRYEPSSSPQHESAINSRLDIESALRILSKESQRIINLRYSEGLSQLEIAQTLDIPCGTVKSRLNRARTDLKEALGPEYQYPN